MPDPSLFKKAPVKVVKRSGFDKSFRNLLTTKCGTLTPLLCDELIPNTDGKVRIAISAQLPPLASDTFMNVNLKVESFFVPSRLLMLGYEDYVLGNTDIHVGTSYSSGSDTKIRVPLIELAPTASQTSTYMGAGTLMDYLGFGSYASSSIYTTGSTAFINALPFLAYHLIWDTWYRASLIQSSCFDDSNLINTAAGWTPSSMRYKKPNTLQGYYTSLGFEFNDGVHLGELRQRNFGMDYFTSATLSPQNGDPMGIGIQSGTSTDIEAFKAAFDSSGDDTYVESSIGDIIQGGFTIASLRAANSLQMWLERNNLCGNRLIDFVKGQYGAYLKDSIAQRPVYLGSASYPVYSKGIYANSNESESSNNNPFTSVGSRYGHAYAEGSDFVCDFHVDEPGYLMILVSLVPEVTYSGGCSKMLTRYVDEDSYTDLANPILQNVGPEPIYGVELNEAMAFFGSTVFGYTDRYASWMTRFNELHGLLRDGQTLASFALQRNFNDGTSTPTAPTLGTEFLEIPTDYMDQVTAVTSDLSSYGIWIDSYIDYKVVMPLQRYCIPSLQDPAYEHGDTVVLDRGGRRLD